MPRNTSVSTRSDIQELLEKGSIHISLLPTKTIDTYNGFWGDRTPRPVGDILKDLLDKNSNPCSNEYDGDFHPPPDQLASQEANPDQLPEQARRLLNESARRVRARLSNFGLRDMYTSRILYGKRVLEVTLKEDANREHILALVA